MPIHTRRKTIARALMLLSVLCFALSMLMRVVASEVTVTQGIPALLNAQTASGTVGSLSTAFMPRCRESAIYIVWGAGTTAGGITVETAHDVNYTGTWAPLAAAVAWSAASKEDVVQITGIHGAIRTRISTTITGGTVSTFAVCN